MEIKIYRFDPVYGKTLWDQNNNKVRFDVEKFVSLDDYNKLKAKHEELLGKLIQS